MLSEFSIKKPYTIIVSVILVFVLGFVSFDKMTVDLLPDMNLPYAAVVTTYPGASPEEIEEMVTKPVEQTMATISNIHSVFSTSKENLSTVMLEFEQSANMDSVTLEMRERLDQVSGFWPDEISSPMIIKMNPSMMPVMIPAISVKGKDPVATTKIVEDEILPEIESIEGVASVTSFGNIEETVQVTLKEEKVSSVDADLQASLDAKFDEASSALNDAKAKAAEGKKALEEGSNAAAKEMSKAEAELNKKDAELQQGKLEVDEKFGELELAEAQLAQIQAQLDASESALLKQKSDLETLLSQKDELTAQYQLILDRITAEGETEELLVAKAAIAAKLALLKNYDATMGTITQGLDELATNKATLNETSAQIEASKKLLSDTKAQLDAGAIGLEEARAQLNSAQLQSTLQMSSAAAQLSVGEAQVQSGEEKLKEEKEKALAAADIKSMLTPEMLQNVLTAQNFDMPAGYVRENGIDYLIRVGDKFTSIEDMENLVIVNMEGIDPIHLKDVADVELVNNADTSYTTLNNESGIMLQIQKQTGFSTGNVTKKIEKRFDELKGEIDGLEVVVLMDQGIYIDMVINSVFHNLIFGAILALLILLLFLKDLRPTFVIACSIPVSILTAIVLMYFSGVTMNTISLSGLALGVGMLVDNSIVVIENIYRMRNEEHFSVKRAAVEGARQVSGAILASTLTTICVFLPIVFTEGVTRQLFVDMGLTIAYSLLASLIAALSIVPMLSAGVLRKTEQKESPLFRKLQNKYAALLDKALSHKKLVLIGALVLFLVSGALTVSKGTAFMPEMESTEISMVIQKPEGTTLDEMTETADRFSEKLLDIKDIKDVGGMAMNTGMMGDGKTIPNQVQFYALLNENRTMSDKKLRKSIEKLAKEEDVNLNLQMSMMDMGMLGGTGITVEIKGRDLDKLQSIAKDVADIVKDVPGTKEVSDGMEKTTEELRIVVDKEAATAQGLTTAQVYQEINKKLKDVTSMTSLDTETDSVKIQVTDEAKQNYTRDSMKNLVLDVTGQDGSKKSVALSDIATFETGYGLQTIYRESQSRHIDVTAAIKEDDNIGLVSHRVEKALEDFELPDGYSIKMAGEDETINEAMIQLLKMLGLAVLFMYLIMVAQFQSLRSPFIIMFTVPLAFTGGLFALWISNHPISVISMIGFVMLSGIIVNNGIVFIDYTNQLIESGKNQREALIEAGRTRLRPIIMTALTTILGLSTLALGMGSGSDMIQPMAIVTIGGLIYGTLLTLFVVPCIFFLFHRREKARLKEQIEA